MRTFASMSLVLLFGLLAAPSLSARVKVSEVLISGESEPMLGLKGGTGGNDPVEGLVINQKDASKPNFIMPEFDSIAHVRAPKLIEAGIHKAAAKAAVVSQSGGKWLNGTIFSSKAERGISPGRYPDVAPKLAAFKPYGESMTFLNFVEMSDSGRDPGFEAPVSKSTPKGQDVAALAKWLSEEYGYWQHMSGKKLAADFVTAKGDDCQDTHGWAESFQGCKFFDYLVAFADLDKDHDATLSFADVFPALPKAVVPAELAWDAVALVEDTDFKALGFPKELRKSILSMGEEAAYGAKPGYAGTSAGWKALDMSKVLTEYIIRTKRVDAEGSKSKLNSGLKFFQVADILPSSVTDVEASGDIKVPTFADVAGKEGVLELTHEDIENWLKKEEQGMENKWFLWTDVNNHAKKMANDVLRWGDGSIPGVKQLGFTNGRLQGEHGQHDQFADVAPRLAVFVHLDLDHDGEIDFSKAHEYMKAALS